MRDLLYLGLFVGIITVFVIVMYQLVIQKYYWGPTGKPPDWHKRDAQHETESGEGDAEDDAHSSR